MRVHITGICGTAMAALAGMLRDAGHRVTGSDSNFYPPMSTFLTGLQIPVVKGYRAENLHSQPDVVVMGNVAGRDNPEAVAARAQGIEIISLPQAIQRFFLQDRVSVVAAGTHGKTTLTSLVAWILLDVGLEPSYLVGGIPMNTGTNYRVGDGRHFVIEGDEYDTAYFDKQPKFLHYRPRFAALTSVEFDHADIYRDLDHVKEAFTKFVDLIPDDGALAVCSAFPHALDVVRRAKCPVQVYGTRGDEEWTATNINWHPGATDFRLVRRLPTGRHKAVVDVHLPLTGLHNVQNGMAALLLARACGVPLARGAEALTRFRGIMKRQQLLGEARGVRVLDDFAHHPTAVARTLEGLRAGYRPHRLLAAYHFESNTSRRRIFQDEYVDALAQADQVYLSVPLVKNDTLAPDQYLDPHLVAQTLADRGVPARVYPDVETMADAIVADAVHGDLFVGMSGRDFDGLHHKVLALLEGEESQQLWLA